ncbi:histidine phosphatase superfamily [Naematelia encephala]|uniref:Histidine phosphatase superfamily n=1 Tax=Naematelia encephala TaxID=71784 RepID=A0A1Y2AV91_9TREE|nr:histidine phosphatase superfamily [Naematelia encephala]
MLHTSPSAKRIHLTRHAQAEHNVANDYSIPDAPLTELGKTQARELHNMSKDSVQRTADLLVCSPLRRPMETMLLGYPSLKSRLDREGKPVILLDILQEVGPYPCDTPTTPISALKAANGGIFSSLDFSTLSPEYASKRGIYHPDRASERARQARRWLRDRPEAEIVVVAHGDILRYIADGQNSSRPWDNAETKVFTFHSSSDDNAGLVEIAHHAKPKDATDEPTSSEM